MNKEPKIAIVCDWLIGGGAEQVVLHLHKMFPEAPIYTSYCTDEWRQKLDNKVVTGYLQKWPFSRLRKFLPLLRQRWFARLNLSKYDLVISGSGNGESKFILPKSSRSTKHICYCHAPTHFYWRHYHKYLNNPGFGIFDPLARTGLHLLADPLRKRDLKASKNPDDFIANSAHTQKEIKIYYGRKSTVIHPPVDTKKFASADSKQPKKGFVTMGRLAPYKQTDIIVQACTELNLPLKVIGRGPELSRLKKLAGPSVRFLTNVSDEEMPDQLASAEAFIFAAYEDFGVAPVEALSAGTPVIAYKAGGAQDYVQAGKNGEFFEGQTVASLSKALKEFDANRYSPKDIKQSAQQFSVENFHTKIEDYLQKQI